jgi:hypothetical protein
MYVSTSNHYFERLSSNLNPASVLYAYEYYDLRLVLYHAGTLNEKEENNHV